MNIRSRRTLWAPVALLLVACVLPAGPALAEDDDGSCQDTWDDGRPRHCLVRDVTLPAREMLSVDAQPNGGIRVEGWDKNEIRVLARVVAQARTEAEAEKIASQVEVETSGTIRARGPRTRSKESWWVSYRLWVPSKANLSLETTNGGIKIDDVAGKLSFRTTNGGVDLQGVGGSVKGKTTNGGLRVGLEGTSWQGSGLDVKTTNGGVTLAIPKDYNAELQTGTTNGGLDVDFPVTLTGRINRRNLNLTLGDGGPPVRVITTNGGVRVRQR